MGVGGWAGGGSSGFGPSAMFDSLPLKNYRDQSTWVEEFVDALGIELDLRNTRFVKAQARANLLDPTYTPLEVVDPNLATATAAPTNAASSDSMLDVLLYIATASYPVDSNLTVAQRQALVQVGWNALRRKGTRRQFLNVAAQVSDGVVYGWTNPPYTFSVILPDGAPQPGFGSWVSKGVGIGKTGSMTLTNGSTAIVGLGTRFTTELPAGTDFTVDSGATWYRVGSVTDDTHLTLGVNFTGSSASGINAYGRAPAPARPWLLTTTRALLSKITPAWMLLGVGYSQFRAGFSGAGETVFPVGARLSIMPNEHFSTWSANALTSWADLGSIYATPSSTAPSIDTEFTANAAVYDLTTAQSGVGFVIAKVQTINNQITHRFQVDYQYTNAQGASVLGLQIYEGNPDGNFYYWNPTTASWSTTQYTIPLPPSTTRTRYACDVIPQSSSSTATTAGTKRIGAVLYANSDGTATTMVPYTLYRIAMYEKFSLALEQAAGGERTLWLPIRDAPNWSNMSRAGGGSPVVEIADALRASYKVRTATSPIFPYHPALSHRAYGANSSSGWTNLLKGSNDFISDWAVANCSQTANAVISPIVGETSPTAVQLTASSDPAVCAQASGVVATNKTFIGGVWVKKLFADNISTTIELALWSTTGEKAYSYTVKQADGWKLLAIPSTTFGPGDVDNVIFRIRFHATGQSIAVASSYLYEVTGRRSVLYPPICQTPVGSTGSPAATICNAITASQGVNVLHPYLQRTLASVVRGAKDLVVVPTYDGPDQPNGVIFDLAQSAAANRLVLRVNAAALELRRWDAAGNQWVSSLLLSTNPRPPAGSMTWLRDTAITIRAIWDANSTQLSAGNANAAPGVKPGTWAPLDTSVASITVGNDLASVNQFDGLISDLEVLQLGAPIS